jgi:hypothetical protein
MYHIVSLSMTEGMSWFYSLESFDSGTLGASELDLIPPSATISNLGALR